MNISELEKRLREKERELWADMTRTEADTRRRYPRTSEWSGLSRKQGKSVSGNYLGLEYLHEVRDALQRVEKRTYGKCVDCGRQIEDHRLDSVPWTPYCLDHQNQHDRDLAARPL